MSGSHSWHVARAEQSRREILEALTIRPMTRFEASEIVSISRRTVDVYITRLHADGDIHISDWIKQPCGHGAFMAVFALGSGTDMPRPKPRTPAEMAKEARRKIKADPVRRVDYLQKARARETRRGRKLVKPDAFLAQFAGLFGKKTQQEAA